MKCNDILTPREPTCKNVTGHPLLKRPTKRKKRRLQRKITKLNLRFNLYQVINVFILR